VARGHLDASTESSNHDAFEMAIKATTGKDPTICKSIRHHPWLMDAVTPQPKLNYSLGCDAHYDLHYADLPDLITATSLPTTCLARDPLL